MSERDFNAALDAIEREATARANVTDGTASPADVAAIRRALADRIMADESAPPHVRVLAEAVLDLLVDPAPERGELLAVIEQADADVAETATAGFSACPADYRRRSREPALIAGIRSLWAEYDAINVQLQNTQADYGTLEHEAEGLRAEIKRGRDFAAKLQVNALSALEPLRAQLARMEALVAANSGIIDSALATTARNAIAERDALRVDLECAQIQVKDRGESFAARTPLVKAARALSATWYAMSGKDDLANRTIEVIREVDALVDSRPIEKNAAEKDGATHDAITEPAHAAEGVAAERDAYRAMIADLLASAHPHPTEHPTMTKQWARARELLKNGPGDKKLREPGCTCHQEEGDSPCPVHPNADAAEVVDVYVGGAKVGEATQTSTGIDPGSFVRTAPDPDLATHACPSCRTHHRVDEFKLQTIVEVTVEPSRTDPMGGESRAELDAHRWVGERARVVSWSQFAGPLRYRIETIDKRFRANADPCHLAAVARAT